MCEERAVCVNGEMICHTACILNNAIIRRGISVPVLHLYMTLRGSPGSSRCPDGVTSVGRPGGFLPDTFPLFLPLLVLLPAWPCLPTFLREPLLRVLPRPHWRPPGAWSATLGGHRTCSLRLLLGCLQRRVPNAVMRLSHPVRTAHPRASAAAFSVLFPNWSHSSPSTARARAELPVPSGAGADGCEALRGP